MPRSVSQSQTASRLGVAAPAHLRDQRGLGQALLEEAGRVEQLVVDDGVVHAHAAFVEDAHDGLLGRRAAGQRLAEFDLRRPAAARGSGRGRGSVSCSIVPVSSQLLQAVACPLVGEVLAPERRVAARPPWSGCRLMLSSPTRPGHCPLQLATVRIGPRWARSPASTWWLYCQTASATISGASAGMPGTPPCPSRWLAMKPWPVTGSTWCPRRTVPAQRGDGGGEVRLELPLGRASR